MKVLVTGATGFIGNYVIVELLKRNIEVIATSTNIDKAKKCNWFNKVEYYPFVFSDIIEHNLFEYFNKPDKLIHLAWQGLPNYMAEFHLTENLPHQKEFLANLIRNNLKDITVTGTCFEYGKQEGELSEDIECKPENTYSIAKNELRIFLEQLKLQQSFILKWVRLFYIFGKGQNSKSLFSQLSTAIKNSDKTFNMSGGEQVRDFLPIEAVSQNIVNISLQNAIVGIINNCSGNPVRVKDFVQQYLKLKKINMQLNLGYYPYSDFEPFSFWGNNEKIKNIKNAY